MAQRAVQNVTAARSQEEEFSASYAQWGLQANEEITALLNSFQMSTTSDRLREQQVHQLENQLRFVEEAVVETRGRRDEFYRTTAAVYAAEESVAHVGQQHEEQARREAAIARTMNNEMATVEAATDRLRSSLLRMEDGTAWNSDERE
eukprot:11165581-Lingulodinium_polyedra.AAC.1